MNGDASFDKMLSCNQNLTFNYADQYFADLKIKFENIQKRILGVLDANGQFTNTALLLSDQCEHSIKFAIFEGDTKEYFKARNEFKGSILKQLDDAYAYLELNNNTHSVFKGLRRVDCPEYPVVALRETLMNAAVHRDYSSPVSTMINVFTDRIEFVTIGSLLNNLTMTDVMNGISQSRNSWLAQVFNKLELIEGFGTGIRRVMEGYKGFRVQPTFTPAPTSFLVVLPNTYVDANTSVEDTPLVNEKTVAVPPVQVREKINIAPTIVTPSAADKSQSPQLTPSIPLVREVTKCLICGYALRAQGDSICHFCMRNDDLLYRMARDYIDEHPESTMIEVSNNTGVPTKKLIQFLREERMTVKRKSLDEGFLQCLRCRTPIRTGKLCVNCKDLFSNVANRMQTDRLLKERNIIDDRSGFHSR